MKSIGKRSVASFLVGLINAGWYLGASVLLVMLCLAVLPLFWDLTNTSMSIPVSFDIDAGALRAAAPGADAVNAYIRDAQGTLNFPTPGRAFLTVTAVIAALAMAIGLWVLAQLRAVFRTLRDGTPFVPANAARIRWIGYAVIGGELARSIVLFAGNSYVASRFAADGLRFDQWPRVDIVKIVYGLIILALAEVFRAGTRLDEDQSLTI